MDWTRPQDVLSLAIAQDWGKLFHAKVATASGTRLYLEASRASIEAVTRKLRSRGWTLRHTSKSRVDRRSDSRYYQSPHDRKFVIRVSNHPHPGGAYRGAKDYVITAAMMQDYNVLGLVKLIEADAKAFNVHLRRQEKKHGKPAVT